MKKIILSLLLIAGGIVSMHAQFARGADISWCTEMEANGQKFYNAQGEETDIFVLMKQIGMTAIRLRVWVNPTDYGYGPWCDKADVLAKAKRAKEQGLDLMIDFHFSDFFTDPGTQTTPLDWKDYSLEQLKTAVAGHTTDVLQALKNEDITPKWIQIGNETSNGMIWPKGKIDWNKAKNTRFADYAALSNAGYDAAKEVFPNAIIIVHHDNAYQSLVWFYQEFKTAGGKFDMIGLSHYPDYSKWNSTEENVASNANAASSVKSLGQSLGVSVMVVETGFDSWNPTLAKQVMQDLFDRMTSLPKCAGIFYWEPEVNGTWKPQYYDTIGWGAYKKGAFSSNNRPTAALDPFKGNDTAINNIQHPTSDAEPYYDLQGRRIASTKKGICIHKNNKVVVR